jgi:hypothetical protein
MAKKAVSRHRYKFFMAQFFKLQNTKKGGREAMNKTIIGYACPGIFILKFDSGYHPSDAIRKKGFISKLW